MRGLQGRIAIVGAVLLVAALALLVDRSRSEPQARNSGISPAQLTRAFRQDQALRIRARRRSALRVLDRPWEPARPDGQPALRSAPRSTASSRLRAPGGCTSHTDSRSHRADRCSPTTCVADGHSGIAHTPSGSTAWPSARTDAGSTCPQAKERRTASGASSRPPTAPLQVGRSRVRSVRTTRSWGRTVDICTSAASTTRISRSRAPPRTTSCARSARSTGRGSGRSRSTVRRRLPSRPREASSASRSAASRTGKVLYTVPIPGFSFDPAKFGRTPDHGIALSPNERRLYLIDTPNGYVHVFNVQGLPGSPPRLVANIKLVHAPPDDGWLQTSRNGRYLYVGRSGDVIDTRTNKIVAYRPAIGDTADFLEIDWRHGRPVATTNRYGVGYARHPPG